MWRHPADCVHPSNRFVAAMATASLFAGAAAACTSRDQASLSNDVVRVSEQAHLRTDTIGATGGGHKATFILVDAKNLGADDAFVTLDGHLTSGSAQRWPLEGERLFVPAGASRTFVLIDEKKLERPEATGGQVTTDNVRRAVRPPAMVIKDLHVYDEANTKTSAATVVNTAQQPGEVVVLGAFHDQSGRPVARFHNVVRLGPGQQQHVRYTGPAGSADADIYVGEVLY